MRRVGVCCVLGATAIVPPLVAGAQTTGGAAAPAPSAPPSTSAPAASSAAPAPPASSGRGHWVYVDDNAPSASASSLPAPASSEAPTTFRGIFEPPMTTWDLNLEGALGWYFQNGPQFTGFLRARPGVLVIRDPLYFTVGPTYDWSPISPATFGLQGEILHFDKGLWAQVGGLVDTHARFGADLALGLSLLGVEGQYRSYENIGSVLAVYVKLRLPIGILVHALSRRAQHEEEVRAKQPH